MNRRSILGVSATIALGLALFGITRQAAAQSAPTGMREVPARVLPVPDTVSRQMQALIARPVNPRHSLSPQTTCPFRKFHPDWIRVHR